MPKKKGGKKGKKGSKKGKKGSKKGSDGPKVPNYKGLKPGGIPLTVVQTSDKTFAVAEIRFAVTAELKQRVYEVMNVDPGAIHLFQEDEAEGRPVNEMLGYSESWAWPPSLKLRELDDDRMLEAQGLAADSKVYLVLKTAALAGAESFRPTGSFEGTVMVAMAAARFARKLRARRRASKTLARRSSLSNTNSCLVQQDFDPDTVPEDI